MDESRNSSEMTNRSCHRKGHGLCETGDLESNGVNLSLASQAKDMANGKPYNFRLAVRKNLPVSVDRRDKLPGIDQRPFLAP